MASLYSGTELRVWAAACETQARQPHTKIGPRAKLIKLNVALIELAIVREELVSTLLVMTPQGNA